MGWGIFSLAVGMIYLYTITITLYLGYVDLYEANNNTTKSSVKPVEEARERRGSGENYRRQ